MTPEAALPGSRPPTPGPRPLLSGRDLRLVRPGGWSLRVDELAVAAGEVLAILGPNGAGKSTLLHVLALLERPDRGDVLLDGVRATPGDLGARRRTAVVLQAPLLVDASVEANVALGLKLHHVPRRVREERLRTWMERTGIAHLARRRARTLSGGEQRRVSLARALALAPEVLFMDEPFAALDAPTHRALLVELPGWLRAAGCATVFVTHDRDDALHLAHRVAVLVDGKVHQAGAVEEVFLRPATPEVAELLGVDNIVPGTVVGADGGLSVVQCGTARVIASGTAEPGEVFIAIHPEHVLLFPEGEQPRTSARNLLSARVERVEPSGAGLRAHLDAGFPLIVAVTRAAADDLGIVPGVSVVAAVKATAVHVIRRG
ncbi:MAG: ABC transporter ATP-binding protein [Chloroflexi bacterium]|nr:ABC transporter ATP-binding protein [Chloroflexota bacterium]